MDTHLLPGQTASALQLTCINVFTRAHTTFSPDTLTNTMYYMEFKHQNTPF